MLLIMEARTVSGSCLLLSKEVCGILVVRIEECLASAWFFFFVVLSPFINMIGRADRRSSPVRPGYSYTEARVVSRRLGG